MWTQLFFNGRHFILLCYIMLTFFLFIFIHFILFFYFFITTSLQGFFKGGSNSLLLNAWFYLVDVVIFCLYNTFLYFLVEMCITWFLWKNLSKMLRIYFKKFEKNIVTKGDQTRFWLLEIRCFTLPSSEHLFSMFVCLFICLLLFFLYLFFICFERDQQ